ncbi:DUF1028 domain-containing protein [Anaerobacillus alkaliphilus]|uniref:DUF1028 domain-containing protein n=1 Tax=Anaerobacillus alkaliphilus TaxID=1548597 RepID=A0A4Q0VPB3_9BACI|nr:DUF1028 domain-containing protein [Anaerobacillus alkaliphilus]RXI96722.1 DUF1028 domain-containing protein [Anaerobacillus alkaliphilus]
MKQKDLVATFSIVGFDPKTEELGIAVQSKFLGVGAVVPWAKAGVGAVATQSYANTTYGPRGLELMAAGKSAQETIDILTSDDEDRSLRQVGIVDGKGNAATFTGEKCFDWAGGIAGKHFAAQGNILVSEATVKAMASTFEETTGTLAERLLAALDAAQEAGGDFRGKQSAALLIVKEEGGYGGYNDRSIDLRVDDHPDPIKELIRIYELQQLYFSKPTEEDVIDIDEDTLVDISNALQTLGYLKEDACRADDFVEGLNQFILTENFEERQQPKGKIDKKVLQFLLNKSKQ